MASLHAQVTQAGALPDDRQPPGDGDGALHAVVRRLLEAAMPRSRRAAGNLLGRRGDYPRVTNCDAMDRHVADCDACRVFDLVAGSTSSAQETSHLATLAQAALLWTVSRTSSPVRRPITVMG
ncbi:hypothetical protein [Catellatospora methionotrophica]|uniref:hypothetical protein n=1 Tax=Catellatospora methionotrophica TaxID=121620 RepID=UPI003403983C